MKQLKDSKNSYEHEQKQFKEKMTEMSELIDNTLNSLDIDALEENMKTLSEENTKTKRKKDELDDKIRETVCNILTRKRTTLGEYYTIREGEFYVYGSTRKVSSSKTHKVLNRLNKNHFNGDENRWDAVQKISEELEDFKAKWNDVGFREETEVEIDKPEKHVLRTSSNTKEKIGKIEKVRISGSGYRNIYFRDESGRRKEKVRIHGTYKSDNYDFKEVYLLASTRNEIQDIQEKQMKQLLEQQRGLEKRKDAVKNHGKSFNVANKLSGI